MSSLSFLMSLLVALSSLFSGFVATGNPKAVEDDFVPVMRFVTTSDTHVKTYGDKACIRIAKLMKSAYQIAASDKDYNKVDAFTFNGDLTDRGREAQYQAFASYTQANLKGDTKRLCVVARSHDSSALGPAGALEYFKSITGQAETDYHEVINGFHFIGISSSSSSEEHYTAAQVQWLDEQLAIAAQDGGADKPIFVFQHEHVRNTVFGSSDFDGWGMTNFTAVLNKYPQAIHISGHSHYPADDPRSIWQGGFTAINDGGLAYYELTVDDERVVHPSDSRKMAQALFVEVDAENRVLVRVYDVTDECFIREYLIDNKNEPNKYSHERRASAAEKNPPVFADGAEMTMKKIAGGYAFVVPQAQTAEDNEVFLYRIIVADMENNIIYQNKKLADNYRANPPETAYFTVDKPTAPGRYCAAIIAEDVWGVQSNPLYVYFDV